MYDHTSMISYLYDLYKPFYCGYKWYRLKKINLETFDFEFKTKGIVESGNDISISTWNVSKLNKKEIDILKRRLIVEEL